ncbi:hypothetical protein F4677DRAFT_216481 [Hypoxylon crocopeplum]|nr:hypothetical protein F4677DRAFT_216481 [Hypoxylon crocopeplum]
MLVMIISSLSRKATTATKRKQIYRITPGPYPACRNQLFQSISITAYHQADDKASAALPNDAPEGQVSDESYATGKDDASIPVVKDDDAVEDPISLKEADSDKQLQRDEGEAIDKNNVLKERTRGEKPRGSYEEPSDEDLGLIEGS